MKKLAMALAMTALINGTALQAAETAQCIPPEQAEDLVTYLLPAALDAAGTKCATNLPPSAAMLQTDSAQYAKYQHSAEQAWPGAKQVIGVLAGDKFPKDMDLEAVRPMIDAMIPTMIAGEIKPGDCETIDQFYTLLEPLPSANLAGLAVLIIQQATDKKEKDPLNICKMSEE